MLSGINLKPSPDRYMAGVNQVEAVNKQIQAINNQVEVLHKSGKYSQRLVYYVRRLL